MSDQLVQKDIVLDLETTGTDEREHGVIQVAAMVVIDDKVEKEFESLVKPFGDDVVTSEALVINGRKREELDTFPSPHKVHRAFRTMAEVYVDKYDKKDKFQLIGFNIIGFDDRFLRAWFRKCGDVYYGGLFWWPAIDVASHAAQYFKRRRAEFARFTLTEVCRMAGIQVDEEKAHDALYDVQLTLELYKVVTGTPR